MLNHSRNLLYMSGHGHDAPTNGDPTGTPGDGGRKESGGKPEGMASTNGDPTGTPGSGGGKPTEDSGSTG